MKYKNIIALLITAALIFTYIPASAADSSPAYTALASEEPAYTREVTLAELEKYYETAATDEILDPEQCNYTYGEVYVGGVTELCHVYMRTFIVKNLSNYTTTDLEKLAKRIVDLVKNTSASKYLKCIARTYNVRISPIEGSGGKIESAAVKIFIACGEKTDDRIALKRSYISKIASGLKKLPEAERFIQLNELILDGRFRYDMTYSHRCSAVALVSDGMGVCEEYAGFTSLVLDALGYKNSIITGEANGTPHMWNLVTVGDRTYHLDILHNGPVNSQGVHTSVLRTFLLVSEKKVKETHTIDSAYTDASAVALYDYVFEGYPTELEGSTEVGKARYIFAKQPDMTVSDIEVQFGAQGFLRVTDTKGKVLSSADTAGSGCKVDIYVNGAVIADYTLCVEGDADGDGLVTEKDVSAVADYIISTDRSKYGDTFVLASDFDKNGKITVTDLIIAADTVANRHTGGGDTETGEVAE